MTRIYRGSALRLDVEKAAEYYELESGTLALKFLAAFGDAFRLLRQYPSAGSPRFGQVLGISGLRCLPTNTFPYLLFYREQPGHLVLSRLLPMSRDMESLLDAYRLPERKAVRGQRNPL